jgi:hypothetical protein
LTHGQLDHTCVQHPDQFIAATRSSDLFEDGSAGLIVHDGGRSLLLIAYCPSCATPTGTTLDD